jgi:hypothetical protein
MVQAELFQLPLVLLHLLPAQLLVRIHLAHFFPLSWCSLRLGLFFLPEEGMNKTAERRGMEGGFVELESNNLCRQFRPRLSNFEKVERIPQELCRQFLEQ